MFCIVDCLNKSMMGGGSGRYSCDECGKLFRHPGSLQHHRHIHRGTHRCPSCGKVKFGEPRILRTKKKIIKKNLGRRHKDSWD